MPFLWTSVPERSVGCHEKKSDHIVPIDWFVSRYKARTPATTGTLVSGGTTI
jgi:hypothetical protein